MPEYIPKARYPQEMAAKVLELQQQKPNIGAELISTLGSVGGKYSDRKNKEITDKKLREQKVADTDEAQISDLIEKGYLELDPEVLKTLKPGESKRLAIKRWIPEEERKSSGGGAGTKYNLPADEMLMKGLEALRNAYDKDENPDAPEYKIDRKAPPTINSVETEINRIKTALSAKGKSVEALLSAVPTGEARKAVEKAGEMSKKVLGATTTKPKVEVPQRQADLDANFTKLLQTTMVPNSDVSYFDAIKSTPDINRAIKAIKKVKPELTDAQAEIEVKKIRGE